MRCQSETGTARALRHRPARWTPGYDAAAKLPEVSRILEVLCRERPLLLLGGNGLKAEFLRGPADEGENPLMLVCGLRAASCSGVSTDEKSVPRGVWILLFMLLYI